MPDVENHEHHYKVDFFVETDLLREISLSFWKDWKASEGIRGAHIWWVLGPADSGKSWMAAHLALQAGKQQFGGGLGLLILGQDCPVKSQNLSTLHIPPTAQVGSYAQVRAIQGWLAELLGLEDRVTAMPVDKALEQLLAGVESGTAVVIIIDGIDEAEREFLDVFEQYFLEPLCRHSEQGTCSISLLLLGRHYYEWRSFFLRQFDEREHVWELKPFEGQDASDVLKIQLPAATTMPSDLEAFIAQGAYPGHIVQAAYAWRDHKSICDVLAYMIHREWESVLGLSPNIGLDLVKSPSKAFTRGQVKALLQEHIPTLQSQGATEKFRQLIEARILHWNSKDERWKLDQAYWLLFKLYLQNCGMD